MAGTFMKWSSEFVSHSAVYNVLPHPKSKQAMLLHRLSARENLRGMVYLLPTSSDQPFGIVLDPSIHTPSDPQSQIHINPQKLSMSSSTSTSIARVVRFILQPTEEAASPNNINSGSLRLVSWSRQTKPKERRLLVSLSAFRPILATKLTERAFHRVLSKCGQNMIVESTMKRSTVAARTLDPIPLPALVSRINPLAAVRTHLHMMTNVDVIGQGPDLPMEVAMIGLAHVRAMRTSEIRIVARVTMMETATNTDLPEIMEGTLHLT